MVMQDYTDIGVRVFFGGGQVGELGHSSRGGCGSDFPGSTLVLGSDLVRQLRQAGFPGVLCIRPGGSAVWGLVLTHARPWLDTMVQVP